MKSWLDNNSKEGKIRKSNSPASFPILLIPKLDGSLRLCVDYWGLNKIRVQDQYPLPRIDELQDRLGAAKLFTMFDLKNWFHLLQMRQGVEWKPVFRTRYGLCEYLLMPFALGNALSTFQAMINAIPTTFLTKQLLHTLTPPYLLLDRRRTLSTHQESSSKTPGSQTLR